MGSLKFENHEYEQHFNTEMWNFCIALKERAVKEDYPFVKYLLQETIKKFDEMNKSGEYLPLWKNSSYPSSSG